MAGSLAVSSDFEKKTPVFVLLLHVTLILFHGPSDGLYKPAIFERSGESRNEKGLERKRQFGPWDRDHMPIEFGVKQCTNSQPRPVFFLFEVMVNYQVIV